METFVSNQWRNLVTLRTIPLEARRNSSFEV